MQFRGGSDQAKRDKKEIPKVQVAALLGSAMNEVLTSLVLTSVTIDTLMSLRWIKGDAIYVCSCLFFNSYC